jgi:hypothetical protein
VLEPDPDFVHDPAQPRLFPKKHQRGPDLGTKPDAPRNQFPYRQVRSPEKLRTGRHENGARPDVKPCRSIVGHVCDKTDVVVKALHDG